jgi:S-DNA-T family DNA segregation ATPase FtsK/SpoIIIE
VFVALGIALICSLVSYFPQDPSWNTAAPPGVRPLNLIGKAGAHTADALLQIAGLGAFTLPVLLLALALKWARSEAIDAQSVKVFGAIALTVGVCTACSLGPQFPLFGGAIAAGGLIGTLAAGYLVSVLNPLGATLATAAMLILSLYLVSTFSFAKLAAWLSGPMALLGRMWVRYRSWREIRRHRKQQKAAEKKERRKKPAPVQVQPQQPVYDPEPPMPEPVYAPVMEQTYDTLPPWDQATLPPTPVAAAPGPEEIPIHVYQDEGPVQDLGASTHTTPAPESLPHEKPVEVKRKARVPFHLPGTELLHEPQGRPPYDSQELKDIAARIKTKFEEFSVLGSVVQINPGPVVTTFEYKPDAGIKYSRIVTLTEDLCLGLQAESVLIERIPGKPTVGIEVPNSRREVISLRQILESDEFRNSSSPLTISLGKDISGRIKVAALDSMPHLLIAGSTGSGKSVMLNTMIMSILYKSAPEQVRMIMVDPKRVELGIYEGVPHLLTPVITDPRKATNALKNAVLEMERRLKMLAEQGTRNIDQYNRKIKLLKQTPRSLFDEDLAAPPDQLEPLPYILIIIDELADLMMIERAGVEESVTRLAQMARAVGMHLVLATQRPSVDVITGLIKANFPARISFRVATRVDSRTILDVMGAEHLLGKGDMLFLPPGSSRLTRVHGAYVTEAEIEKVVTFWKEQGPPEYDPSLTMAPPSEDEMAPEDEEFDGEQDPMYQDAVRVVLEMGKASTSTLQRRLRLGYGRAARILDMMQREGIIGPPDGPRPREVLKRPDWLEEIEQSLR